MTKKTTLLSLIALVSVMAACHKSSDKPAKATDPVEATWNLTNISVSAGSTVKSIDTVNLDTLSFVGKVDYAIANPTGSFQFTSDSLYINNLSYTKDTLFYGWTYENSVVEDSFSDDWHVSLPATNLAIPAKQISSSDSIYFPAGTIPVTVPGYYQAQLVAYGGKYSINGSVMTLTLAADSANSYIQDNEKWSYVGNSKLVVTLQKQ